VIVAEEQARESNGQISEEGFVPATSATIEAAANQTLAEKKGDKRMHPLFRRTSTSTSTSTNMDDEKPRKRRKVAGAGGGGKVKEEPIELEDSDEELDRIDNVDGTVEEGESLDTMDEQEARQAEAERYVVRQASVIGVD
jgi:hypothetical protein